MDSPPNCAGPYVTRDVDVTPARTRENFTGLRKVDAKLRIPDMEGPLAIRRDEQTFGQGTIWTFVTKHGYLDIALLPDGTRGYDDLRRSATQEQITDTVTIFVAALANQSSRGTNLLSCRAPLGTWLARLSNAAIDTRMIHNAVASAR